ncbi:ribonuclease HII [Ectobacillus ponti]|uniref:Ribonuclease HII n=1 Tax=Ectobacillus ponti TaxID=2961894 RepID=A0AA42BU41_9BACI|nr:ribonuclease HII [Ectobacillus ponti]MCP8970153.1 ribonuclease HII [Ectobacillus ponti]
MEKLSIAEAASLLQEIVDGQDDRLQQLLADERKGVQKLVANWHKRREQEEKDRALFAQMCRYEQELRAGGVQYIAGVDEVGRGPLAGPVVTAAVVLPESFYLAGLNDSKKLSEAKREQFYEIIMREATAVGIGIVGAAEIDELNIYQATKKAMLAAILQLQTKPEHLLIDAMELPLEVPQTSIIKGDASSVSIAAASVVAKVTRDRMMKELGAAYPQYGFEKHMGYGTKEHLQAIESCGVLPEHRKSFAPIKHMI